MSSKKLTVYDATKDELIEFFFDQRKVEGVLARERFLSWLWKKRNDELLDAQSTAIDASQRYLSQYVTLLKQATEEPDLEKKMIIFDKANKAYSMYEKAEKDYEKLDKKLEASMKRSYI